MHCFINYSVKKRSTNHMETLNRKAELEQEIRNLESRLLSVASPVGDWKVAKCMEYQIAGLDMPYDINELHEQRQAIRDRINEIQEELAAVEE